MLVELEKMRIMTFNLRFENDKDGKNSWSNRRGLVVEVIRKYAPCVLGTQEGTRKQLSYLQDNLPDYLISAPERIFDATCQYPTLFYRVAKCGLLSAGEFWLSKTPRQHRSKNWDSAFPRMMSYSLLQDLDANRPFWAVVTHLDHMGAAARREQAKIIAHWVAQKTEPVVLMGDFNAVPGSPVHDLLGSRRTGLRDTWQALGRPEDQASMTHHGFAGIPQRGRLDWIMVSEQFRVCRATIVRDRFQAGYPSDHYPYMVELEWRREPV